VPSPVYRDRASRFQNLDQRVAPWRRRRRGFTEPSIFSCFRSGFSLFRGNLQGKIAFPAAVSFVKPLIYLAFCRILFRSEQGKYSLYQEAESAEQGNIR
jgi:hypothetical protein